MSGQNKYISNQPNAIVQSDTMRVIQMGVVESVDDPNSMGRIKVRIPGPAQKGGDNGISTNDLAWAFPMIPKFFSVTPKVGEGVFVIIFDKQKTHSDRLYFGPIISTSDKLNLDPLETTALSPFTFAFLTPPVDVNRIPALKGVFPSGDDISIQGRYNTDLTFKKNEVVIRAGKFVESQPNKNNLLTHQDGSPRFNLTNQDDLLSNEEILNILDNAHQLAFGDIQLRYLVLLKKAFLNHVHNNNGMAPTDLVIGGVTQDVREFKKNAENLENRMLSNNIRIN